jgi:hypothetical protein
LATRATVKRAIDAGASGAEIRKNTELMAVINDVREGGNAWFVGRLRFAGSAGRHPRPKSRRICRR